MNVSAHLVLKGLKVVDASDGVFITTQPDIEALITWLEGARTEVNSALADIDRQIERVQRRTRPA